MSTNRGRLAVSDAMERIFLQHQFSDVTLQAEGQAFPVARVILAARSPVFQSMLYGDFKESCEESATIVLPDIPAETLHSLLEYIYTGWTSAWERSPDCLLDLLAAADRFAVLDLVDELCNRVVDDFSGYPCPAARACQMAHKMGAQQSAERLFASSLLFIKQHRHDALVLHAGVQALDAEVLEAILRNISQTEVLADETLFRALVLWADRNDFSRSDLVVGQARDTPMETENATMLKTTAAKLAELFVLEFMSPTFLKSTVASSGLVSASRLLDAALSIGVLAESIPRATPRAKLVWQSSGRDTFTETSASHRVELSSPLLLSGRHTWRVTVGACCGYTWFGLASLPLRETSWLGMQDNGWVLGTNGCFCHATGQDSGPYDTTKVTSAFSAGAEFTFELDLTPGNETFIISEVDCTRTQQKPIVRVSMQGNTGPFLPAASMRSGGSVKLADYVWRPPDA